MEMKEEDERLEIGKTNWVQKQEEHVCVCNEAGVGEEWSPSVEEEQTSAEGKIQVVRLELMLGYWRQNYSFKFLNEKRERER